MAKKGFIAVLGVMLMAIGGVSVSAQSVTGNTKGIDSSLLSALRTYARLVGHDVRLTWAGRTYEEQQEIWDRWLADGGHLSSDCPGKPACQIATTGGNAVHHKDGQRQVARPGRSKHELGQAADVDGLKWSDCATLNKAGLRHTVPGEPWHVELGSSCPSGL